MKTFNQFKSDSGAIVLFAGLDRRLAFNHFAGLNRKSELTEVYVGGNMHAFLPDSTEENTHTIHRLNDPSDSIIEYTGGLSTHLNKALLDHYATNQDSQYLSHVKHIDSDLSNTVAHHDFVVYSGLPKSPLSRDGTWDSEIKSRNMTLNAYTSASTDIEEAAKFTSPDMDTIHVESNHHGKILPAARHVLQIHVKTGLRGIASIRHVSTNAHEKEFLLARGHTFELHHRPTEIIGAYAHPVYVWHATMFSYRPNPVKVS